MASCSHNPDAGYRPPLVVPAVTSPLGRGKGPGEAGPFPIHEPTAKGRWRVSATALALRLHQLGHLTDWQYRAIAIHLAHHGYRSGEPAGIARETSDLLPALLEDARARHGVSLVTIADELALPVTDVRQLIFERGGLVAIEGDPDGSERPTPPPLRIAR